MAKYYLLIACLCGIFYSSDLNSQGLAFNWQARASLPEAVSNNAVCAWTNQSGQRFAFSFGGIDTSKQFSGIHLRSYRYDYNSDQWTAIASIPDTLGKIAMGASMVKDKIYVIGGYHVFANGGELSSDKVHVFNPQTNLWEADAASIPVAIDDHVQLVWRDSLIFVITGWSDVTNIPNVQIFNPSTNQWSVGTSVPDNNLYKAFGASGILVGDTIVYTGGARSTFNFPLSQSIRFGVIDPADPTQISWFEKSDTNALGYRQAAVNVDGFAVWFGGSDQSYNYDGLAYTDGSGVPAESKIEFLNPLDLSIRVIQDTLPAIMDLRGIADFGNNSFLLAGGMEQNQTVTDRVLFIDLLATSIDEVEEAFEPNIRIQSNRIYWEAFGSTESNATVFDLSGKMIATDLQSGDLLDLEIGIVIVELISEGERYSRVVGIGN